MDIPPSLGQRLYPFSHFLGYRAHPTYKRGQAKVFKSLRSEPWVVKAENIFQTFMGAWIGLAILGAASKAFPTRNVPTVVGSFGAEAVLLYAAPTSPMAQPRNIIIGMALSSIIGMAIAKLFALQTSAFPNYTHDWAAAATTVAISLMVTQVFNIPHPPGGASALLAATNKQIFDLSWFYVGYIMIGSCLMLGWGLIINNLGRRRYPQYWISPDLIYEHEEGDREKLGKAPGSSRPEENQG